MKNLFYIITCIIFVSCNTNSKYNIDLNFPKEQIQYHKTWNKLFREMSDTKNEIKKEELWLKFLNYQNSRIRITGWVGKVEHVYYNLNPRPNISILCLTYDNDRYTIKVDTNNTIAKTLDENDIISFSGIFYFDNPDASSQFTVDYATIYRD